MEHQPNTNLGQYQLGEVIGRSAAAVVYRARQPSLNRLVAVKVLLRVEPRYVSRFEREAQSIAQLQHRNILPIYDYGVHGSWRYIVMQYVERSTTLAQLIEAGPMDCVPALRLLIALLGALEYAHAHGVIHRDIKPSNILMPTPDWPLLADFGIAKLLGVAQQLTPPGQAVGTAAYMAPEAGLLQGVDARADLYSSGVVLYELLTGRLPFEASTPLAVLAKHIQEPPPPPRTLRPDLHPSVEGVLMRALQKSPDDRFQSAAEMAAAMEQAIRQVERAKAQAWLRSQLSPATPASLPRRSGYTTRTLPATGPGAALPAAAGVTLPAFLPRPRPASPAPPRASATPTPATVDPGRLRGLALLLALLLLLGLAVGTVALWPRSSEVASGQAPAATAEAPAPASPAPSAEPTLPGLAPTEAASAPPVSEPTAQAAPTDPPPPQPTAEVVPTDRQPPQPTSAPSPAPPQVSEQDGTTRVLMDDQSWGGGYSLSRGSNSYGGRTATWIYGTTTTYSAMTASFELERQPVGEAALQIEGMDSEGRSRTPISIVVNGAEIFRGPNPLPDDDLPLESGTWARETWRFDAALLQPGRNQITIRNLAEGSFGGPPFFMLDYAELSFGA